MIGSNYLANSIMTPLIKLAKKVSKTAVFSRSGMLEIINQYIKNKTRYISNKSLVVNIDSSLKQQRAASAYLPEAALVISKMVMVLAEFRFVSRYKKILRIPHCEYIRLLRAL